MPDSQSLESCKENCINNEYINNIMHYNECKGIAYWYGSGICFACESPNYTVNVTIPNEPSNGIPVVYRRGMKSLYM